MSYSSHAPYAPPDSWSAGAPTAAGSSSTRRALPSSPLPPSSSSSAAAAYSRWSPSSATVLLNDEPAPPTAGRKRSHTTLCEFESHDDGGGGRPPAGAREADDDGHSASSYYGSEFDRFREPVADAGGGGDVGAFDRPDADANDELDEERAYRRIEERLKRRRGERAAHANRHDVADGSETLRSSFGSGEYRLALDGSPTGARDVEPMQVEPALPLPSSALFRPPSSLPPLSSPAAAAALDPSASRPWAFGSASTGRAAPHSPIASPAAPPFTAPVHAMSSSYSRAAHSQQRSSTPAAGLPLSMRRRPPLVRNATAVPAPLSPEISRPAAPAEGGRSYFHPTPPPTMPNSTAAARSRFSSPTTGTTQPTPAVDPSPTTTTFVSRANASLFAPRRPGAMDASGRLRGPSRSANESWLGIRTDSPPPVLSSVEAGATFDLSGGSGSGGRVSPPLSPSDVASSSTGRSSARAWAPIGTGSSARSLFSSPPQPTRILSRPWSGVGPPSDDLQLPPAPASSTSTATAASQSNGLRPFRLRPRAVAPLLPVTTSPSASARRTSLLAQLGSANEEEESLVSDLGSTGVVRSRFDSAADGFSSARRRRAHPVADTSAPAEEGDAAGPGPSSSPPPFSSFRPLLLGEGLRSREAMTPPPAPTLSFLRPLQLPLSANGSISPVTVAPSPAPHRSRPAPPILTATFGADDDDEDDFGSSSPELEDSLPPADLSRLNPQTRLPVMLSSGLLSGRGEASTASSTALPSFSSALASDWSSTPASPPVVDPGRPDRRTPMLRPLRTTDHGFSARFAAGPAASSAPSSSTESMPPSSFAPFSDSLASGAAGPSLSSERASTSTASTRRGEPSGAGSRLAEYLSRHSERRRRLLPGLFEPDEPAGERQGDEWSGSLMDWFSTRPNSTADPAEIQQTEEQLAARRRRLHELRRSQSTTAQPAPAEGVTVAQEPSSSLSRTLEALGTRSGAASDDLAPPLPAPLTGASIWDALLYPSPSSSIPHPSNAAQAQPPPPPPASTRFSESGLPTSPRSREAMLHALLRQISADLSSLSPPEHPSSAAASATGGPGLSFLSAAGSLRRRDHGSSFITTGPMAHHPPPPPIPFGLRNLLTSLSSSAGPSGGLGSDLLTEDEIDLSYEGLLELSARVPAVVRATPDWVVQGLKVGSYRDEALRVGGEVDERCAVCLEDYLPHDLTMTSLCGHFLHKGCLEEWLRTSHVCPLCRADVIPATDAPRASLAARAGRASPTTGSSMDVGGGPYF